MATNGLSTCAPPSDPDTIRRTPHCYACTRLNPMYSRHRAGLCCCWPSSDPPTNHWPHPIPDTSSDDQSSPQIYSPQSPPHRSHRYGSCCWSHPCCVCLSHTWPSGSHYSSCHNGLKPKEYPPHSKQRFGLSHPNTAYPHEQSAVDRPSNDPHWEDRSEQTTSATGSSPSEVPHWSRCKKREASLSRCCSRWWGLDPSARCCRCRLPKNSLHS